MRFRPLSSNSVLPFDAGCTRHGGAAGLSARRFAVLSALSAAPRGGEGAVAVARSAFLFAAVAYASCVRISSAVALRWRIQRVEASCGGARMSMTSPRLLGTAA